MLFNTSNFPYEIKKGQRVAQAILHEIKYMDITEVPEFSPAYNLRGTRGFGSTGGGK